MQPVPSLDPALALPHLEEVSTLLREQLRDDWVVRIEHLNPRARPRPLWRTWGQAQYIRQGVEALIERILGCHAAHPDHSIRLCAEKLHPQARLVYWVHPGSSF